VLVLEAEGLGGFSGKKQSVLTGRTPRVASYLTEILQYLLPKFALASRCALTEPKMTESALSGISAQPPFLLGWAKQRRGRLMASHPPSSLQ
jgi:hypothetical protein